jgi:hypothetical protein
MIAFAEIKAISNKGGYNRLGKPRRTARLSVDPYSQSYPGNINGSTAVMALGRLNSLRLQESGII